MPTRVVLDANALMMPFERQVRIEEELERLLGPFEGLVPESVLRELAVLAAGAKGGRAERARMALSFAARFRFVASGEKADRSVLTIAKAEGAVVFSDDREVLAEARRRGLRTVRLKGLSHLELEPR